MLPLPWSPLRSRNSRESVASVGVGGMNTVPACVVNSLPLLLTMRSVSGGKVEIVVGSIGVLFGSSERQIKRTGWAVRTNG